MADGPRPSSFKVLHPSFYDILGPHPILEAISDVHEIPVFHEAFAYDRASRSLFVTSGGFSPDDKPSSKTIALHRITGLPPVPSDAKTPTPSGVTCTLEEIKESPSTAMPNGGISYNPGKILLCVQGHLNSPSGIVSLSTQPPYKAEVLVQSYHGRSFSSPNDVIVSATDSSIWFTDPPYGHAQDFRPPPELPPQIYRFDPSDNSIRVVADGFVRPNGLCFSPDENTLYVTDTSCISGRSDEGFVPSRPGGAHIYAFTVDRALTGHPFLTNKRLFAHADSGIPDGIKCDTAGNVYSGCGDGIHVWNRGGVLLGKILVEGGVANFCFGEKGEMFIGGETRLWYARLGASGAVYMLRASM